MIHRQSNEMHFRQVAILLRRRWVLIATAMLVGGGLVGMLAILLPPKYTAKAQLLYEAHVQDGVEIVDDAAVETLVEMLVSPSHMHRLASALAEKAERSAAPPQTVGPAPDPAPWGRMAEIFMHSNAEPVPVPNFDAIEKDLNTYKERKSRLISVTFTSPDPQMAARVANRSVDLYLSTEAARQRDARESVLKSIGDRLITARTDLDQAVSAVRDHRISFGMTDPGRTSLLDEQIADLNRQLNVTKSELAMHEKELRNLHASGNDDGFHPVTFGTGGDAFSAERGSNTADGASQGVLVSATQPSTALDAQTDTPPGLGPSQFGGLRDEIFADRDAAQARLRDIETRLATLQQASSEIARQETQLIDLQNQADAAGSVYKGLLARQSDLLGQEAVRIPARVVTIADVPDQPSSPSPVLFVLPAMVAFGMIGGLLAVLLERLDQRLRSQRDVEDALGIPCFGLVPKSPVEKKPSKLADLLQDRPFAPLTDAIRAIVVAATQPRDRGVPTRTFMITSSDGEEGKTMLALAFAIYSSQLNRRVLLIDLDFRSPGISHLLGNFARSRTADPGRPSKQPMLCTIAELGIDYLPLSEMGVDPIGFLSSETFRETLAGLEKTYDCIVIESAPLSRAVESRLLARMVDRVILAVRWGATKAPAARMALQQLRALGEDRQLAVAAVVTQVRMRKHMRRRYDQPGSALAAMPAQPA